MAGKVREVYVDKALSKDAVFEGAMAIARISGCSINTARELMNCLPGVLGVPLYKHQAQRLVRELSITQTLAPKRTHSPTRRI